MRLKYVFYCGIIGIAIVLALGGWVAGAEPAIAADEVGPVRVQDGLNHHCAAQFGPPKDSQGFIGTWAPNTLCGGDPYDC